MLIHIKVNSIDDAGQLAHAIINTKCYMSDAYAKREGLQIHVWGTDYKTCTQAYLIECTEADAIAALAVVAELQR